MYIYINLYLKIGHPIYTFAPRVSMNIYIASCPRIFVMIGKQIIGYILLFKLKGINSKDVRHKNDDSCRRTKNLRRLSPKKII